MKTLKIGEKEVTIRKLKYLEFTDVSELAQTSQIKASNKMIQLSTGLTDEEMKNLELEQGIKLAKAVNEENTIDFQIPVKENVSEVS